MEGCIRQLGLDFDAGSAQDREVACLLRRVSEERGLADSRLSS
jgi:hypothetical protein